MKGGGWGRTHHSHGCVNEDPIEDVSIMVMLHKSDVDGESGDTGGCEVGPFSA
jgi:hypothetical protein